MKKFLALMIVAMMAVLPMTAFAAAPTPEETTGFAETPIGGEDGEGEEIEINDENGNPIMVAAAVYFQPVDMLPDNQPKANADIHLEVDVSAAEGNILGYEAGTWIPYMTVEYEIIDENGDVAASGTFMTMNASDGPHYGGNVKMPNDNQAALYTLRVTFRSPAENGYLLHIDSETGVEGRFWEEPIVIEFANWEYVPLEY